MTSCSHSLPVLCTVEVNSFTVRYGHRVTLRSRPHALSFYTHPRPPHVPRNSSHKHTHKYTNTQEKSTKRPLCRSTEAWVTVLNMMLIFSWEEREERKGSALPGRLIQPHCLTFILPPRSLA